MSVQIAPSHPKIWWGKASCFAALLIVVMGEIGDVRARRHMGPIDTGLGDGIVVVLGFPGHNWAGRTVQRWRVQMAVAALRSFGCSKVLFTGGATRSEVSEAAQMAGHARLLGLSDDQIVLEERSTSTWENVTFARRLIGEAEFVVFVSEGVHARRAHGYWLCQFPELRLPVRVDPTYRPFDHFWIKTPSTLAHLTKSLRRTRPKA